MLVEVIRPLQGSGASSWALFLALQEELKASKTAEFDESVLLDGHLSVALGNALTRYTAGKTAATPLWSRSLARYAVDFSKWAETSGVNVTTTHPHGGNSKTRQMAQREKCQKVREACSVTQRNLEAVDSHARVWTTGQKSHAAAAQWRAATSSTRVDQTGSQPHMISESRCRAKLHGIFKLARLSSLGIVVLSGVLSPGFDLNSNIVRNVLRGWITHGDIAAAWLTRPLALSTVSCLLEACQQANVVGLYAELHNDTAPLSFVPCAAKALPFCMCRWICALLASHSGNV